MTSIRKGNHNRRRAMERANMRPWFMVPNGFEPRLAQVGDKVKLGFRDTRDDADGFAMTEWMWADVVHEAAGVYTGIMRNNACYCDVRAGMRVTFTADNVLTTYENCPMRAMNDLEPFGGSGNERLERLRVYEAETGLSRRDAVAALLATLPQAA